jgi:trehalose/maltose transport system substrate-binding protein
LDEFTRKTGIRVKFIPGPESATQRLEMYSKTLQEKSPNPDVYYVDMVWPALLSDYLLDLNPYLAEDAKQQLPFLVRNATVDGRLVAMPFNLEAGLLYYRTDLMQKYGYSHPPETWDELETMAAKIQSGERAAGHRDFWGYVWQGAAYEGLTCNALEWQASFGGGKIIESDGTISVNNPQTILAIKKAKSWVGTISPPGVTAYKEEDSRNLWASGNAAFARDWVWIAGALSKENSLPIRGKVAATRLPSGGAGHVSALGGQTFAVSKYSAHPRQAAEFVRYLASPQVQFALWTQSSMLSTRSEFYEDPQYLHSRPDLEQLKGVFTDGTIVRPSAIAGKRYDQVSRSYFSAVHSILTGEVTAEKGLADLESDLVRITGFKARGPVSAE